jgi:zinc transporter
LRRGQGGALLATPMALLDHLLHDQADELQRIAGAATERVDAIEDALLAGRVERHGAELASLRRLAVRLQRLLAPDPGALNRTIAHPPPWLSGRRSCCARRARTSRPPHIGAPRSASSCSDDPARVAGKPATCSC